MRMFKFLSKAYKTHHTQPGHRLEIDFNDPELQQECTHTFAEDHAQEFIDNIYIWIDQYEKEIRDFKREKVGKEHLFESLYRSIMASEEKDLQDLRQIINSPEDLRDFITKNHLKIKTSKVGQEERPNVSIEDKIGQSMKILIFE